MLIILTHPNGWATREQHFLKQALQNVGPLYKNCQITFVTEGEASVHFCMFYSNMRSSLQPGDDLTVCDAGGSTIDTTTYHIERVTPSLEIKERKASACIQMGGVFVDLECEKYFKNLLTKARIDEQHIEEYVAAAVEDFESIAKKEFASPDTAHHINLHDNGLKQAELGIRRGRMSLKGSIIESFFDRAVSGVIQSIRQQTQGLSPKYLLLVGGFGESPYLRHKLSEEFMCNGCQVTVIEESTSKAAADGAVIWAIQLAVVGRVTRVAYGISTRIPYNPSNPEHQGRRLVRVPDGNFVSKRWYQLMGKGIYLNAQGSVRHGFYLTFKPGNFPQSRYIKQVSIWIFHGDSANNPSWVRDKNGNINHGFEQHCKIEADLSGMRNSLERKQGADGPYDELGFDIVIRLGGTELHSHMEWVENGTTRSGPTSIIPEPVDLPPAGRNMLS